MSASIKNISNESIHQVPSNGACLRSIGQTRQTLLILKAFYLLTTLQIWYCCDHMIRVKTMKFTKIGGYVTFHFSVVQKSLVRGQKCPPPQVLIGLIRGFISLSKIQSCNAIPFALVFSAVPGGGALRCFRYRVCAAGQGIVFTILAPEPGIVSCKNAPKRVYFFQIFAPRQDYSVFS